MLFETKESFETQESCVFLFQILHAPPSGEAMASVEVRF